MRTLKLKNIKTVKFIKPQTKYRKYQLRSCHVQNEQNLKKTTIKHGNYSLLAQQSAWLTGNQLESARKLISRSLKKSNSDWKTNLFFIKILPNKALSAKSKGVRMGKGKGLVKGFVFQAHRGRVIFEIKTKNNIYVNLLKATKKFPIKTRFTKKETNLLIN